jgi:chaperonin GroES
MKIRPLRDNVLLKRIEGEEKTKGGIVLPETAQEKPAEAEVVAAGPGRRTDEGRIIEPSVKKGDRVLFGKWSGTEIEIGGEMHLIIREDEILAVVEK